MKYISPIYCHVLCTSKKRTDLVRASSGGSTGSVTGGTGTTAHEGTAEETDTNHEQPAGDSAETPDDVAKGNVELVLGEQTVNGVEDTLVRRDLLVGLL